MRRRTTRAPLEALTFEAPSTAYGAVAPALREEPRRGLKVLGQVLACTLVCGVLLACGAGQLGAGLVDVEKGRRDQRARQVVAEAIGLIAALPYHEVEGFDGASLPDSDATGYADFRVDFSIKSVGSGLQVQGILLDARTRLPIREFVAWRGRG